MQHGRKPFNTKPVHCLLRPELYHAALSSQPEPTWTLVLGPGMILQGWNGGTQRLNLVSPWVLGTLTAVLLAHWVSRLRPTTISCIDLVSYCFISASPASPQFFACILFQYLKFPPLVPLSNFLHSRGLNM